MARRRCTDRPLRRSRPAPPRPQRHQPAGHSGPPALADRLRPRRPRRRPGRPGADARPTDPIAGEAGNRSRLTAGPVRAEIRPPTVELINGAEPKACWRPLAGEERPDRFASKLPPTGGSGEMLPSSVGGRLRAKGGRSPYPRPSAQRPEHPVTDRPGDVEVAVGHDGGVVVHAVQPLQAPQQRQPHQLRIGRQVVGQVQQLVAEVVAQRGDHEQPGDVRREQPGQQQPGRQREGAEEEHQQHRREQNGAQVAGAVHVHLPVGEEAVVLDGVALVDQPEACALAVHHVAVPEVLGKVGVEEGQRNGQPLQRPHLVEQDHAEDDPDGAERDDERQVPCAGIAGRHVAFAIVGAVGAAGAHAAEIETGSSTMLPRGRRAGKPRRDRNHRRSFSAVPVGGRLRAKGQSSISRASSLQQAERARHRTEGLLEAACGRRVAGPVREQAPSNSRSERGAEPKACRRPLAGEGRLGRFASKLPPTGLRLRAGVYGSRPRGRTPGCGVHGRRLHWLSIHRSELVMSRTVSGARRMVECLEAEGVKRIYGVPGEENLDLLEALRESPIQLIVTRHEQAAGFMAAAEGRLTGRPGVCMSTLGPGATNFVTAAAYAQLGAMPMVMLTGQKPIKSSKQGHFQILDVVDLMQPVTHYAKQIVSADLIPARVREAFRQAEEERPGAAHLELPEDIARDKTDAPVLKASEVRRPVAEEKAIARAVDAIQRAERPLLMIGAGANRKLTSKMLRAFVDKTGMPFFSTQMGKGVVGESEHWMGTAALSDGDYVHRLIDASDCIINVGHDVIEKPPFFMHEGEQRTVIHVNFFTAEVDPVYFPQLEVTGDIANAIWQITERIEVQDHWDFAFARQVRKALIDDLESGRDMNDFPVHPRRLVHAVRDALPEDGIVSLDNGLYKVWFARNFRTIRPNTLLLDNALATMGAGLPVAMSAKMAFPQRKVLAVCGDGGVMMNSQELETAVRLGLDLVVLILRDDAYGMIRWKQADMDLPDFGLQFGNPDFVRYAESYGARGHRADSVASLEALLAKALDAPGVDLIDCRIDYRDSQRVLFEEIPAASQALE